MSNTVIQQQAKEDKTQRSKAMQYTTSFLPIADILCSLCSDVLLMEASALGSFCWLPRMERKKEKCLTYLLNIFSTVAVLGWGQGGLGPLTFCPGPPVFPSTTFHSALGNPGPPRVFWHLLSIR